VLRRAIERSVMPYDVALIDCPPSLGLLTLNALVAASEVLIPVQCEYYALAGLAKLLDTVSRVRGALNEKLEIAGVVLTMYDGRTNLARDVVEEVRKGFPGRVFETLIPRSVRLAEAPSHGQPISIYDPYGPAAVAYRDLAEELMKTGSAGTHSGGAGFQPVKDGGKVQPPHANEVTARRNGDSA
jgi:chromosome partitioning protein